MGPIKQISEAATPQKNRQTPDISHMADDTRNKANNDKPFFFAALRLAIGGNVSNPDACMDALSAFAGLIQHGGRPLEVLTETEYLQKISPSQLQQVVATIQTFREGFLVNSEELTTCAHFCPPSVTEHRPQRIKPLESLAPSSDLSMGVQIGVCDRAGRSVPVCIPLDSRSKHAHLIGGPGMGKSCLLENMILQEIALGHGVAVLDPHGPLIKRLLQLMPAEYVDRVIHIRPSDPSYVPIWNPLQCGATHDPGRLTGDLVRAIYSIVEGWGERLAHLLRHAFFALLHLPDASLSDVADLLRKGTSASEELIHLITSGPVANPLSRRFWLEDFPKYTGQDLRPPQHKLSTLLLGGKTVSLMLSQPDSKLNLRHVMDEGKILLVDLSDLGSEVCDTLGCFMLALLHLTALGRLDASDRPPHPFHIYCDEAHRFITETIDDVIAETRKYGVSLTLAHQFMSQFTRRSAGALSGVASPKFIR